MGRREMISLHGITIIEMYQGRRTSALQGAKQEAVTEFCKNGAARCHCRYALGVSETETEFQG